MFTEEFVVGRFVGNCMSSCSETDDIYVLIGSYLEGLRLFSELEERHKKQFRDRALPFL
jgi:hypothetical protein